MNGFVGTVSRSSIRCGFGECFLRGGLEIGPGKGKLGVRTKARLFEDWHDYGLFGRER